MIISESDEARHPIQVVSQRTGLTLDVIRVWERRYQAVRPHRLESGRRLYSDGHVERLLMLRRASQRGLRIGDAVKRSEGELKTFLDEHDSARSETRVAERAQRSAANDHLRQCRDAIRGSDVELLHSALNRAQIVLSAEVLIGEVLVPLTNWIGEQWSAGNLRIAQEHMASTALRDFLGKHSSVDGPNSSRPLVLMATPTDQRHELGALMVAMGCIAKGWRVHYLGPDLPAAEIVECARLIRPAVIALSLVYPVDDPRMADQLLAIRDGVGPDAAIIVGGRAAPAYRKTIAKIGARLCEDVCEFMSDLDGLTPHAKH